MRKFVSSVRINATPEQVWAVIADQEGMPRWFKGAKKVTVEGPARAGVGRKVFVGGPVVLDEVISHWEPNKLFGYRVRNNPLVKNHQGLISITPAGGGSVEVTYSTELQTAIPIPGDPLGFAAGTGLNLLIGQALRQLKKNVERS